MSQPLPDWVKAPAPSGPPTSNSRSLMRPSAPPPPPPARPQASEVAVGRLSRTGVSEPWHIPLLLPNQWYDFTQVIRHHQDIRLNQVVAVEGVIEGGFRGVKVDVRARPARMTFKLSLCLDNTRIFCTVFGDVRPFRDELEVVGSKKVLMRGTLGQFGGGHLKLQSPSILSPIWAQRLQPAYSGIPRILTPDTVRKQVLKALPLVLSDTSHQLMRHLIRKPGDEEQIRTILAVSPAVSTQQAIERRLFAAHLPRTVREGQQAQAALERLAAYGNLQKAIPAERATASLPPPNAFPNAQVRALPFKLSADQLAATQEIVQDLRQGIASHRLLSGDVGSGKTVVYGLAAIAAHAAGGQVGILLPNDALARQVYAEFVSWWPDLKDGLALIVGGHQAGRVEAFGVLGQALITIGTTALLSRPIARPLDLLVIDEQQRFSRDQREQLAGPSTHLLEVTATCIPRTQALLEYGVMSVSKLRPHVTKNIKTTISGVDNRRRLFDSIRASVAAGEQVLVVYPMREDAERDEDHDEGASANQPLPSATAAYEQWEKLFPGRCVLAHGGQTGDEKQASLRAMRDRQADILVATTVVEVGLNIPGLRHIVIVHPERLGLVTLHQLRGRVARTGGKGRCDLYLPREASPKSMERLQALVKHSDGFALAEADMLLRGVGDLGRASERQSGADNTFLFGRPLSIERLNEVAALMNPESAATDGVEGPVHENTDHLLGANP